MLNTFSLNNNIRVATYSMRSLRSIHLRIDVKGGSVLGDYGKIGLAHFLEHMAFKGTKKRPSAMEIEKEIDSLGAGRNAGTSHEYTNYWIKVAAEHTGWALEILADMLLNPVFPEREIEKEKGVVIEEINMYEDNPIMYIEDVFEEVIFNNTDLGRSIAGPRINISTISRSVLHNYYKNNYYNGNAIIGLAGKFDEKKALALINKLFPVAKKQKRLQYKKIGLLKQNKSAVSIIKRDLEQVQLMLGFRSPDIKDKQFLSSQLLANILGGSMSSRLFLSIRERKGLCYFIRAGISAYQDHSAFYIRSGLNKLKIYEALSAIKEEVEKVRLQGVSALEFSQAKENMRGRLILKMEEASNNLSFLLSQEIIDQKIKDFDDKLKELDKISLKQINALAADLIDWSKCSLSIIGPFSNKNKFINILKK